MSNDAWELSGVELTLKACLQHFHSRVVLVKTDKVTQACIICFGGRAVFLSSIAWDLRFMCYSGTHCSPPPGRSHCSSESAIALES